MSYDLRIWSVRPFERAFLGRLERSKFVGSTHCTLTGDDWQIVINASNKVLPEDVDDEIAALVPGIAYLTELNLEGDATNQAFKLACSTAKQIAKRTHGVVEDPQSDRITTPAGVTRFLQSKKQKSRSVLVMSWWFLNDIVLKKSGRRSFLALLGKVLPEALPKRYGEYEPPQYLFAKTGIEHLEKFMKTHLDSVMVWYPNRPVTGVLILCPDPLGSSENGFRAHHVAIQVESAALDQPGWTENLRFLWRQMTFLLRPIYGEVRTDGQRPRSGPPMRWPYTTRSWFWRGIPRRLGQAVVLGREYQRHWPRFVRQSTVENGFAFASTPDWSDELELSKTIGPAPEAIALLPGIGMGRRQRYPRIWPFSPPFGLK